MLALALPSGPPFFYRMANPPTDPIPEAKILGRALKALRKRMGHTQATAAEAAGVEPLTWRRYEAGARKPTLAKLQELCSAIGSSRDELLSEMARIGSGATPPSPPGGLSERETRGFQPGPIAGPLAGSQRQAVFTLEEGDVTITFPAALSAASRRELSEYLATFQRRLAPAADAEAGEHFGPTKAAR